MKTAKLIIGILTLVSSMIIIFQSCAAGLYNVIGSTGDSSGSLGFLVAIIIIAAGVVMIVTRNTAARGGSIACLVLYLIAGLFGVSSKGVFADLIIWGGMCLFLAAFSIVGIIVGKKEKKQQKQVNNSPSMERMIWNPATDSYDIVKVTKPNYCPKCGQQLDACVNYCTNCGSKIM